MFLLYTGEMLGVLSNIKHPRAEELHAKYVSLNREAAAVLAEALEITAMPDDRPDFFDGHYAAAFGPKNPGDPMPKALDGFDNENEWGIHEDDEEEG